ncbi:MAG TPA: hypothetical protein VGG91_06630 [Myxococcaceae bacterium]
MSIILGVPETTVSSSCVSICKEQPLHATPPPSILPFRILIALLVLAACGTSPGTGNQPPPTARDATLPGTAAVRVEPWTDGRWIALAETLQSQFLVTMPKRKLVWLDAGLGVSREYLPPEGRFLIDFAVHPSGVATALELEPAPGNDLFLKPIRAWLTRFLPDGTTVSAELDSGIPDTGETPPFLFSLDRGRIVPVGEDVLVAMRWSDNSVRAHRLEVREGTLRPAWTTVVEPPAILFSIGIIGGGFDNFHQGDTSAFVYLDVDSSGTAYVVVPSTADVLPAHDAFFGEHLLDGADPTHFDYGVAIITRLGPDGSRSYAALSGLGTNRRLLNVRATASTLWLAGRIRTGAEPTSWDGWLQVFDAATGHATAERQVDVQGGDMFWDLAPLDDGSVLCVGSTNYTQNPNGLSVSDARDDLAVIVGPDGAVRARLDLPAGPAGRGNEVTSVRVIEGRAMFAGVKNAPGTHAEVLSDAFLSLRPMP